MRNVKWESILIS